MIRWGAVLVTVVFGLSVSACGGSGSGSAADGGEDTPAAADGAADPPAGDEGSVTEADLGTATLTVDPEGSTAEVTGSCEIAPEGFEEGTVEDLGAPGVEVAIAFDNTSTESEGDFGFNMTSTTTVQDDGTFVVQSRGGVDNDAVSYRGSATAEITESSGLYGTVAIEATLTQSGPVTDPTGSPAFADQPAERTIVGEIPCTIGIA